jgi:5-methylcytosine-specific restriction enzyme subunit McrC
MIKTVDNFYLYNLEQINKRKVTEYIKERNGYYAITDKSLLKKWDKVEIKLKDYLNNKNNVFFSFFDNDEDKKAKKNEDDLIFSIIKDGDDYKIQTGNYVGKLNYNGVEIEINSRFSNIFLERMLNFANDIFLDDVSIAGKEEKKDVDISKYIIYYLFVQTLEKAFLLGFPKRYKNVNYHESEVKGNIDINRFINNDIPFKGKISTTNREQKEVQEIIDVLYRAIIIIEKTNKSFLNNIKNIKTYLKQNRSKQYVSNQVINKALKSKSLNNPIFSPYKKILKYTKYIINDENIKNEENGDVKNYGFIINIAELFEIYVRKLLQKEFPDWSVESPKIELYEEMFFTRKIIPDIVIQKEKDVIVLDTKYKKMKMDGRNQYNAGDVDRNDFFQINTYMSYYQNNNCNVKIGGLIYPMGDFDKSKCYSEKWFGNLNSKFIIDGVLLKDIEPTGDIKFENIAKREKEFIERLNSLL